MGPYFLIVIDKFEIHNLVYIFSMKSNSILILWLLNVFYVFCCFVRVVADISLIMQYNWHSATITKPSNELLALGNCQDEVKLFQTSSN